MHPYHQIFTSAQIADAAGMSHDNFRAMLSRKGWRVLGEERSGNGRGHNFTIYDALTYALARELVNLGVEPARSFDAAVQGFAHTGDDERSPGNVFDFDAKGWTLFVYWPQVGMGKCIGTKMLANAAELLLPPFHTRASSAIIVNLNDLRDRVFGALGLDARDYE